MTPARRLNQRARRRAAGAEGASRSPRKSARRATRRRRGVATLASHVGPTVERRLSECAAYRIRSGATRFSAPCRRRRKHAGLPHVRDVVRAAITGWGALVGVVFAGIGSHTRVLRASRTPGPAPRAVAAVRSLRAGGAGRRPVCRTWPGGWKRTRFARRGSRDWAAQRRQREGRACSAPPARREPFRMP